MYGLFHNSRYIEYRMSNVRLYRPVPRVRRMCEGAKRRTLPNQCMSLAEMFRRFVRRESLPVEKQGVYIEGEHDLEKLAKMDRVDQDEILDQLKADTERKKKAAKEADQKITAEKEAKKAAEQALQQAAQNPPTGSKGPEGKAA